MFGLYFQLSLAKRQILLLETLKVKQTTLEPIPSSLKLVVSVTCYWLQHTEAKAKLHHLQALLLGMLMGPLHVLINSPGRYLEIPGVKFCTLPAHIAGLNKRKNILALFTLISCIRNLRVRHQNIIHSLANVLEHFCVPGSVLQCLPPGAQQWRCAGPASPHLLCGI